MYQPHERAVPSGVSVISTIVDPGGTGPSPREDDSTVGNNLDIFATDCLA